MATKWKSFSALKNMFRSLIFFGVWLGPLFFLYYCSWEFAKPFLKNLNNSSWKFVFFAVGWWLLSWISMYFLQTIWPVLLLIFYRTERERSPKKIINIGERFRNMKLPAPQIFILQGNSLLWKNKVWGFFFLPSPLGALMLMAPETQQFSAEMLDAWICRKVIESGFSRFSSARFLFFSWVPTLTLLGAFAGSAFSGQDVQVICMSTLGFLIFALFIWRDLQIQRQYEIDRKTVSHFQLEPKEYYSYLELCEKLAPSLGFVRKILGYNFKASKIAIEKPTWFRAWIPWILPPSILGIFIINFFILTPSNEVVSFLSVDLFVEKIKVSFEEKSTAEKTSSETKNSSEEETLPFIRQNELSQAVINGDLRSVIHQVGLGKNINSGDPALNGATPLMLALKNGDLEMAYFLMAIGANPQIETDSLGQTALFYATEAINRQQVIAYMLKTSVDVYKINNEGLTVLDYAKKNGRNDVIELLLNRSIASEPSSEPVSSEK